MAKHTQLSLSHSSSRVLPKLTLKYFKHLDRENRNYSGVVCHWCKTENITIGGGFQNEAGKPHFICENCAVKRYMQLNSLPTYEAALARRRRIFDVEYLFQEQVIDLYLGFRSVKFEHLDDYLYAVLVELGQEIYRDDEVITPSEKRYLEERIHQSTIERHMGRILDEIDLDFEQLPSPSPFTSLLFLGEENS